MHPRNADQPSIDWTLGFRTRAYADRIPISATLELTSRCNLRCRHCYLGNQEEQHSKRSQERDTAAVLASLDEWAAAGCLYLLITGGDPMMRKDFAQVYRHARELGMLVTVFCDGILVTPAIIELFKELPPRKVEVSIYGSTPETYETVTRVPGSHANAWRGIRRLHDNGIRIGLKTVLMSLMPCAIRPANLGCPSVMIPRSSPACPMAPTNRLRSTCGSHPRKSSPTTSAIPIVAASGRKKSRPRPNFPKMIASTLAGQGPPAST
jgi:MoaA/NifB/PqqE/SkfB family radical SAM enzyme